MISESYTYLYIALAPNMQVFSCSPNVYIGCTASNKTPARVSRPGCGYMLQTMSSMQCTGVQSYVLTKPDLEG